MERLSKLSYKEGSFILHIVVGDEAVDEFLEKLFGEFGSISLGLSDAAAGL